MLTVQTTPAIMHRRLIDFEDCTMPLPNGWMLVDFRTLWIAP
jgi:hypothetical protein